MFLFFKYSTSFSQFLKVFLEVWFKRIVEEDTKIFHSEKKSLEGENKPPSPCGKGFYVATWMQEPAKGQMVKAIERDSNGISSAMCIVHSNCSRDRISGLSKIPVPRLTARDSPQAFNIQLCQLKQHSRRQVKKQNNPFPVTIMSQENTFLKRKKAK